MKTRHCISKRDTVFRFATLKERPILFSAEMVRAILDGRKTQTRRIIKPQPKELYSNGEWYPDRYNKTENWCFWGKRNTKVFNKCGLPLFKCRYEVGSRLWVRETFCIVTEEDESVWIDYRATPKYEASHPAGWHNAPDDSEALKWQPSIYMPKKASRITLEITNIRVERVQDITEDDARAEGIEIIGGATSCSPYRNYLLGKPGEMKMHCSCARRSFQTLWDSINSKRGYSWESNPWVWVIEFKRI